VSITSLVHTNYNTTGTHGFSCGHISDEYDSVRLLNSDKVIGPCHQTEYETEWGNIINIYNIIYLKVL